MNFRWQWRTLRPHGVKEHDETGDSALDLRFRFLSDDMIDRTSADLEIEAQLEPLVKFTESIGIRHEYDVHGPYLQFW